MNEVPEEEAEGEGINPGIEAGWRALEAGDVETARAAARTVLEGNQPGGSTAPAEDGEAKQSARLDALLLTAACAREEGDVAGAIAALALASQGDPEWCTPELWTAELLAEQPERLSDALKHARRALDRAEEEDEYLSALACKASIELELGRPTDARKTLRGLPAADVPFDDPGASLDFAELLIDAGDPGEARARMETLVAGEPRLADAWYLLGIAAELLEDEEGKRAAWVKTRTLDLEMGEGDHHGHNHEHDHEHDHGHDHHHGPQLSEEALTIVAEQTLADLPEEVRSHLKDVPIVVADLPAASDVATGLDPRVLGLFSGTPHAQNGGVLDPPTLTEIVLFRRNIQRVAVDEESLRDEVRTTLLHEAGHFFGLDEAALARLGLD